LELDDPQKDVKYIMKLFSKEKKNWPSWFHAEPISDDGTVFNSKEELDKHVSRRYMFKTMKIPTCMKKGFERLEEATMRSHYKMEGGAHLLSYKNGTVQEKHIDFLSLSQSGSVYTQQEVSKRYPYVLLGAFQEGTALRIEGTLVKIPKGACLIMRGDVVHQGCAYNKTNIRFHMYLIPEEFTEHVGEFVGWVEKSRRKQVKPHVPQYAPGVVEDWEQKKEDLVPKQLRRSTRNINQQLCTTHAAASAPDISKKRKRKSV
jgi:hypothetical protein